MSREGDLMFDNSRVYDQEDERQSINGLSFQKKKSKNGLLQSLGFGNYYFFDMKLEHFH